MPMPWELLVVLAVAFFAMLPLAKMDRKRKIDN